MIASGIDTLIVAFYNLPHDPYVEYYESYIPPIKVLERYKNTTINMIIAPCWTRPWYIIPEDQRFVQNGKLLLGTPCPISQDYIDNRIDPALELINQGFAQGILWDTEHYEAKKGTNIIPFFGKDDKGVRCECKNCEALTWEEQWKKHRNYVKFKLQGLQFNGHFPYNTYWSLDRYPDTPFLFTEDTYSDQRDRFKTLWMFRLKRLWDRVYHGVRYTVVPGIFIETLPLNRFFEYLKYCQKAYGGYWIYSQKMFSKYSKMGEAEIEEIKKGFGGYYETRLVDVVDVEFFERLNIINKTCSV